MSIRLWVSRIEASYVDFDPLEIASSLRYSSIGYADEGSKMSRLFSGKAGPF